MSICFVSSWRAMIYRITRKNSGEFSIFLYPLFADFYFRDQKSFPFLFSKKVITH